MARTRDQLKLDFETPERRRGAMLCVLETWRFPEEILVRLIRLNAEKKRPGSEPALRKKNGGGYRSTGIQHRVTSLLKAIHSFGRECFASVPTIAARMGVDTRTAQRAIADAMLPTHPVLSRTQGSHHATCHYQIEWNRLFDWTHFPTVPSFFVPESGVTPSHPRGDTESFRGDTESPPGDTVSPNTQTKPQLKPRKETTTRAGSGFLKSGGVRERGGVNPWPFEVSREDLQQLPRLRELLAVAITRGWCNHSTADELRFVTLCLYCAREGQHPARLLTHNLSAGQWRGTLTDEDRARKLLSGRCLDMVCPCCQGWGDRCSRCGRGVKGFFEHGASAR
jgi:hypothetical protein